MVAFDPQLLWNGVVVGSLIALAALGLTLLFGLLNFINIAYGEYLAWGAYIALGAKWADVPFILAIVLGAIGAGLIAVITDRIVGGIGDPVGAVVGGYALGIGQNLSIIFIPSEYTPAFALLILIIGLLTRPSGLFGEATR